MLNSTANAPAKGLTSGRALHAGALELLPGCPLRREVRGRTSTAELLREGLPAAIARWRDNLLRITALRRYLPIAIRRQSVLEGTTL
ncbi:MAG: hypothetical protein RID07_07860, partial [Lacipirellulaceae bacterium]